MSNRIEHELIGKYVDVDWNKSPNHKRDSFNSIWKNQLVKEVAKFGDGELYAFLDGEHCNCPVNLIRITL